MGRTGRWVDEEFSRLEVSLSDRARDPQNGTSDVRGPDQHSNNAAAGVYARPWPRPGGREACRNDPANGLMRGKELLVRSWPVKPARSINFAVCA